MYTYQKKITFIWYQCKYILRKIDRKLRRRLHIRDRGITSLYGYGFADLETVQAKIYDLLMSGKPCMVGRLGGIESLNALEAIKVEMG